MKRFLLSVFLGTLFICSEAQITWDGGGNGTSWDDAANWAGDAVPTASDDVLLDNSVVPGSYTVTLPGGAVSVSVNSLTITPSVPNNITLINPVTNTSSTAFIATGSGDAIVLNEGAIFINSSGADPGTTPVSVTGSNFFRINNGGRYIHNTLRGHTDYLVSRLSTAAGTEDGIFEFDVPDLTSYTISASGRTYGHLILSATASGGSKTYTVNAANSVTINGNLEIKNNAILSYGASTDTIVINKNCIIYPDATFNIANDVNNSSIILKGDLENWGTITETGSSSNSIFELNGSANQNISGNGIIANSVAVKINNLAGITLLAPLTLPYKLSLADGKINTTSTNILTMLEGATWSGGSSTSFVEGPMQKRGSDDFIFPVGIGNIYAPVGYENVSNSDINDVFTAEYIRANPFSSVGNNFAGGSGIDHTSYVEYWQLEQNAGNAVKRITLTANAESFCKDINATFISRHDIADGWTNEGGQLVSSGSAGIYETGILKTTEDISAFGYFTFATGELFSDNPLPVNLISFNATKTGSNSAILKWELATGCSPGTRFEIERSVNNTVFVVIAGMNGSGTNRFYSVPDNDLKKGINYYRLKITDTDGKITYSRIAAVLKEMQGLFITSVSPNPVSNKTMMTVVSDMESSFDILVMDLQGRVLKKEHQRVNAGNNTITLSLEGLISGIYQLAVVSAGGETKAVRIVKQ